jgi:hypothetical protein
MATWLNNDGLLQKFGNDQATPARVGKHSTDGEYQELVVRIVGTEVGANASPTIYKEVGIPQGAQIESAKIYVKTAFDSAADNATLTIGVWSDDGDGTYTVVDADGIDATVAQTALDPTGDTVACDGAMTVSPASKIAVSNNERDVYISAEYGTAAFTAGEADLVVRYRMPMA